jgi:ribosome recycling factor
MLLTFDEVVSIQEPQAKLVSIWCANMVNSWISSIQASTILLHPAKISNKIYCFYKST